MEKPKISEKKVFPVKKITGNTKIHSQYRKGELGVPFDKSSLQAVNVRMIFWKNLSWFVDFN